MKPFLITLFVLFFLSGKSQVNLNLTLNFYFSSNYDYDLDRNTSYPIKFNSIILFDIVDGKGKVIIYYSGKKQIFQVLSCEKNKNYIKFFYSTGGTSSLIWEEKYYVLFTLDDPRNNTAVLFHN
ncbi:hypothetical protein ETU08_00790 [Apibacter muscae]|uniref:hypothetical protein n=1 Tax=Apibacter muscae TaxID=2509004 RepID=UPI0011AD1B80|nr:hypothetical protein [Apibacter muscae]TWP31483.1 hypothetical protein ETU08_00790 [Apibacter muscae]